MSRVQRFSLVVGWVSLIPAMAWGKGAEKPNILLILADDLGWHQVGCYGSEYYETPYLDRLAQQGLRFTSAYCAAPVCSPTRASLMTGKYPARLHLTDFLGGKAESRRLQAVSMAPCLSVDELSLAEQLQLAGYATGHFGKWHLNVDKHYQLGRPCFYLRELQLLLSLACCTLHLLFQNPMLSPCNILVYIKR